MTDETPTYLTTGEAADLLGVSSQTVVNWIKTGKLDAIRTLGGHRRIDRTVIEQMLTTGPEAA